MLVFILAAILAVWILAGWPAWLWFRASRGGQLWLKDDRPWRISILICVRNGEIYLRPKLESILNSGYPPEHMEIVVVSDGSTDRTEQIAKEFSAQGVQLISKEFGGKAEAINAALDQIGGELLVITDVRQRLEPGSLNRLVAGFADDRVGAISGQLVILEGQTNAEANIGAYWRFESWVRRQLSALDSMFGVSGSFFAIRRELVPRLPADTLLDDMYIPLKAFFAGFRVVVETEARVFDLPTGVGTEFRRKVRTLAGNYQLLWHYPQLLGPSNRLWLDFVSYKLGRLVLPYVLLVIFCSSWWLPWPWNVLVPGGQLMCCALAVINPFIGEHAKLKKLSAPAWTFGVMMAAAACAVLIWFVPARTLWQPTQVVAKAKSIV